MIVAPLGQDARAMAGVLTAEGIHAQICGGLAECVGRIDSQTGALLLTEEALELPQLPSLIAAFRAQPAWSELPVIVLTRGGGEARRNTLKELTAATTVSLLERPMQAATLLNAVQVALRSRRRQHQMRELLEEQQRRQDDLRQAVQVQAKLASIVESSDDAIVSKDLTGVIMSWNSGAQRLFGYSAQEAIGRPITMLLPPDRFDEEPKILEKIRRSERVDHYETQRRRKDGSIVDISLTVSPIVDAEGKVVGASKIARDVTERRKIEQERRQHAQEMASALAERTAQVTFAERKLATAERMAAVGTLAAGLAHDINNVLFPLSARLDSLMATSGLTGEPRNDLNVVVALIDHLRQMSRNLSMFSRDPDHEGAEGRTDLASWVGRVKNLIEIAVTGDVRSASRCIHVKWDVPESLPAVNIAPHRLTQMILNLAHNARDAIFASFDVPSENRRPCDIVVKARLSDDGQAVNLTMIDDGVGMSEEVRRRSIEPFFTTKDRPREAGAAPSMTSGSGMGLALVLGIVQKVGGKLDIESQPGKGAAITVTIPIAPPGPQVPGPQDAREPLRLVHRSQRQSARDSAE
jgi:PAS domain S-box-containing protein